MPAYAPIAIFLYNRPDHTERLFRSLSACPELAGSPVTVYCDGPRRDEDRAPVMQARAAARALAPAHAVFVERTENRGLAGSLIAGVSEQCETHGCVIVLEDDLELAPCALAYFNEALRRYADEPRVMHIAGYMYPVKAKAALPESFFYREISCWGWATWQSAWRHFNPDSAFLYRAVEDSGRMAAFDAGIPDFFSTMLRQQRDGMLDSWAIRWYASVFLAGGLALHPGRPVTKNNGHDGTGVHCIKTRRFEVRLAKSVPSAWPGTIEEDPHVPGYIRHFRTKTLRGGPVRRIARRVRSWVRGCLRR